VACRTGRSGKRINPQNPAFLSVFQKTKKIAAKPIAPVFFHSHHHNPLQFSPFQHNHIFHYSQLILNGPKSIIKGIKAMNNIMKSTLKPDPLHLNRV
jgi:hypothetical protein